MWTHLERIAGAGGGTGVGSVGGIGTRGPGERQIEIDRRIVEKRISFLKEKLREIDERKVRQIRARRNFFTISLVGYTNAGKSTLLNALTGAGASARHRLFETLDTLTRRWDLGAGRYVLLSDTVGFIRDLPHHLVASFRATLEEAIHADLVIHVADASAPALQDHIQVVNAVLAELKVDGPRLLVLNKIDALDPADLAVARRNFPDALPLSARNNLGLDELRTLVEDAMLGQQQRLRLSLPAREGRAISLLERYADVLSREYEDGRAIFDVRITPRVLDQVHRAATDILHLESA
jgi:GTP-binding protein HflX